MTISLLVKCASVVWLVSVLVRVDCGEVTVIVLKKQLQHNCWFVWYGGVLRLFLRLELLFHVYEVASVRISVDD